MGYTAEQISELANIGVKSVYKRLKNAGIEAIECASVVGTGRPVKVYSSDALDLFPQTKNLIKGEVVSGSYFCKIVKARENKQESTSGKSRMLSDKLNQKLVDLCKFNYFKQGEERGLLRATREAIEDLWHEIVIERPDADFERFVKSYYGGYLNRGKHEGLANKENWRNLWKHRHKVNESNAKAPTAHYEILKLLVSAGWIGEGFGAGKIWVIDGTQFDSHTRQIDPKTGRETVRTFNYLQIFCGITKKPLYIHPLLNGETIKDVAEALQNCVAMYGAPEMGIVADAGSAFKSKEIQALVRSWYSKEQLDKMRNDAFRKQIFGGSRGVIVYPLKGIPRFFMKASIERSFEALNLHQRKFLPISYYGTRDRRFLTHDIGTNQKNMIALAPDANEAFYSFLYWIYTEYIHIQQPGSMHLSYIRELGIKPTPFNAWYYFGGKFAINENEITIEAPNKIEPPETSKAFFALAKAEKRVHAVTPRNGYVTIVEGKKTLQFFSDQIFNLSRLGGEKVQVVLSDDKREAYIFEFHGEKTAEKGKAFTVKDRSELIEYLGSARSGVVDELSQLSEVKSLTRETRRNVYAEKDALLKEALGDHYEYRNYLQPESAKYAEKPQTETKIEENKAPQIEEAEYKVIDSPIVLELDSETPPVSYRPERDATPAPEASPPLSGEWLNSIENTLNDKSLSNKIDEFLEKTKVYKL